MDNGQSGTFFARSAEKNLRFHHRIVILKQALSSIRESSILETASARRWSDAKRSHGIIIVL